MNVLNETVQKTQVVEIRFLAHVWQEDEVWNISAFDLPIVAYGDDLDSARSNFEEAVVSHFETLHLLNKLSATVTNLHQLEQARNFWEERAKPQTLVERFAFPSNFPPQLCAV